jgi:glycosyltransferase involved in cell wall biosynthesis
MADFTQFVQTIQNNLSTLNTVVAGPTKLLFVSTDINQASGYGRVSHAILNQIATIPSLSVVHYAIQKFNNSLGRTIPSNIKTYSAFELEGGKGRGFGIRELPGIISKEKPNIILFYNDSALVATYIEEIRRSGIKRDFKIWIYLDQIYTVQPVSFIDLINRDCDRVFAMSKKWKECLKEQGLTRPCDVISHGIDTSIFRYIPKDIARQTANIPKDAFVFLSVNRNHPRKRLDLLVMSFVELIVKYPAKLIIMMCVCDKGDKGGYPLFEIYARELKLRGANVDHFANRLMVTTQDMVYKDEDINIFYNMADVGVSCAEGEGFGLCTFEGMATGVPQIVPDIIGYREYCNEENSILVKPTSRYYLPSMYSPVGGEAFATNPSDITNAMEKYMLENDLREMHSVKAKETVLAYTWKKATSTLVRRLEEYAGDDE